MSSEYMHTAGEDKKAMTQAVKNLAWTKKKEIYIYIWIFFKEVFQRRFDEMLSSQAASSYLGLKVS